MASVAALTELVALWPGDVVVVDDVLAPPSLRTIIDKLDFAYWWPLQPTDGPRPRLDGCAESQPHASM